MNTTHATLSPGLPQTSVPAPQTSLSAAAPLPLLAGSQGLHHRDQARHQATSTSDAQRQAPPRAVRWLLKLLERIDHGHLQLQLPDGSQHVFGKSLGTMQSTTQGRRQSLAPPLQADLQIRDWGVLQACLARGDIAFGETYIEDRWRTNNLAGLLELISRNRDTLQAAIYGRSLLRWVDRLRHLLKRNTRKQARQNIAAHYDLGNPFYALWLDPTMTYSSAVFARDAAGALITDDLQQAQQRKYRRMVKLMELPAQAEVLEIGCGWGGFAETLIREQAQARMTGLTLSTEQLMWADQRLADVQASMTPDASQASQGAGSRAQFRLQDYRDHHQALGRSGHYDGIASIEMFEAVGEAYWPQYFSAVHDLLKPGGKAAIQTIVIADALFDRYRRSTDFIQQYVFPGGMLPSPSVFRKQAERAGLQVAKVDGFGLDYAETLRIWREQFIAQRAAVQAQGFDPAFIRLWEFYLAYCEAGFRTGDLDVLQIQLVRPACVGSGSVRAEV